MSSSDLLTSARGPGVIGMLLALLVLLGFGTLFMLAFDEGGPGGGKSLASRIREADQKISASSSRIESGETVLSKIPDLKRISNELMEAKANNGFLDTRIAQRKSEIAGLKKDIANLEEDIDDYKNQYRAFVRNNAEGTRMDELKTLSGEVYTDVDVRKVSAVGIEIRHRDGHKRIGFEDLPEEMQDYYQFDKDQMLAEVKREAEIRKEHNRAVAISDKAVAAEAEVTRAREMREAREKATLTISEKRARLTAIDRDIQQLESDLANSESAASSARSAGRMHLSKSGGIRNRIRAKQAERAGVEAEIANLRASL